MTEIFITKIQVHEARNIRDLTIPLSETERRHLIITGKNGSGKTSLLQELVRFLEQFDDGKYRLYASSLKILEQRQDQLATLRAQPRTDGTAKQIAELEANIDSTKENLIRLFGDTDILFSAHPPVVCRGVEKGNFLIASFEAKRQTQLTIPTGIEKVPLKEKYQIGERASPAFIQYLVNLKAERSFARDDGEEETVRRIDAWFTGFENRLKSLFQSSGLQLRFDRKNYNFTIIDEGKHPFDFTTLSDGYSAILSIVTDLLLRMEGHGAMAYDLAGVVLIDEIETHLHVDLQKKVLPFLMDFFPKIQFVVTTHSPFVLSSVSNAVICDLETRTVAEDLSAYSYDALIESYFESDKYSDVVKEKVARYEALSARDLRSAEEEEELALLADYFSQAPKYLSRELAMKLESIWRQRRSLPA